MSAPPIVWKVVRYLLYSGGAGLVISGVVNIVATFSLIEAPEEQSLGITRGEFVTWFACEILAGLGIIVLGWKLGRRARDIPPAL